MGEFIVVSVSGQRSKKAEENLELLSRKVTRVMGAHYYHYQRKVNTIFP
jgi:hypothetical protein